MITYVVKLGYQSYSFKDQQDAVIFATTARLHATDTGIDIRIILDLPEDLEDLEK